MAKMSWELISKIPIYIYKKTQNNNNNNGNLIHKRTSQFVFVDVMHCRKNVFIQYCDDPSGVLIPSTTRYSQLYRVQPKLYGVGYTE